MATALKPKNLMFVTADEMGDQLGRTDIIIVGIDIATADDGPDELVLSMPQFGVQASAAVGSPDADVEAYTASLARLLQTLVQEAVVFYQALCELPDDYITEIEKIQLNLFHRYLFPWFTLSVGADPDSWAAPTEAVRHEFA